MSNKQEEGSNYLKEHADNFDDRGLNLEREIYLVF